MDEMIAMDALIEISRINYYSSPLDFSSDSCIYYCILLYTPVYICVNTLVAYFNFSHDQIIVRKF